MGDLIETYMTTCKSTKVEPVHGLLNKLRTAPTVLDVDMDFLTKSQWEALHLSMKKAIPQFDSVRLALNRNNNSKGAFHTANSKGRATRRVGGSIDYLTGLNIDDAHNLSKTLSVCIGERLTTFEISGVKLSHHCTSALVFGLQNATDTIVSLSFKDTRMGDDALLAIMPTIRSMKVLESLRLAGCSLTDRGGDAVVLLLKSLQTKRHGKKWQLTLRNEPQNHQQCICGLVSVDLSDNYLTDNIASALSDILMDDESLKAIDLSKNCFTYSGITILTDIIRRELNRYITYLNLSDNNGVDQFYNGQIDATGVSSGGFRSLFGRNSLVYLGPSVPVQLSSTTGTEITDRSEKPVTKSRASTPRGDQHLLSSNRNRNRSATIAKPKADARPRSAPPRTNRSQTDSKKRTQSNKTQQRRKSNCKITEKNTNGQHNAQSSTISNTASSTTTLGEHSDTKHGMVECNLLDTVDPLIEIEQDLQSSGNRTPLPEPSASPRAISAPPPVTDDIPHLPQSQLSSTQPTVSMQLTENDKWHSSTTSTMPLFSTTSQSDFNLNSLASSGSILHLEYELSLLRKELENEQLKRQIAEMRLSTSSSKSVRSDENVSTSVNEAVQTEHTLQPIEKTNDSSLTQSTALPTEDVKKSVTNPAGQLLNLLTQLQKQNQFSNPLQSNVDCSSNNLTLIDQSVALMQGLSRKRDKPQDNSESMDSHTVTTEDETRNSQLPSRRSHRSPGERRRRRGRRLRSDSSWTDNPQAKMEIRPRDVNKKIAERLSALWSQ